MIKPLTAEPKILVLLSGVQTWTLAVVVASVVASVVVVVVVSVVVSVVVVVVPTVVGTDNTSKEYCILPSLVNV